MGPKTQVAIPGGASPLQVALYANLAWYAFLGLVALAAYFATGRVWDDVFGDALHFLFLIMGGGFTLATVLDVAYERHFGTTLTGEKR